MNQAHLIDLGIKREKKKKITEKAKCFKKWHGKLLPIKYIFMVLLIFLTQFERPEWCLRLSKLNNYQDGRGHITPKNPEELKLSENFYSNCTSGDVNFASYKTIYFDRIVT